MRKAEFAAILASTLNKSTSSAIVNYIKNPPGRKPSLKYLKMSEYYNNLDESEKEIISSIVEYSVEMAIFNFLCIIDGVYTITGYEELKLELYTSEGTEKVLINTEDEYYLHELFLQKIDG